MNQVNRRSVIRSLLWKFLERCSVQLVSFIVSIVLARILTPKEYGVIALVLVFVNIAGVIVEGGLNTALIQKKNADQLDFSTIFYSSIGVALVFYGLLYISAPSIANFYNNEELTNVVKVLSLSIFFYAINSVQKAYLTRNLLFKSLFYSSFGAILASGFIGIYLAIKGFGVWALVIQSITSQIATTVIMWFTVKWRPTLEFSWKRFRKLFDFGWKIFASNLLVNVFINIRSLIIGKVYNASALAYFDRGKQFPALIIENINTSVQAVIFPVLSSIQDDRETVKAMVRRSIKSCAFIIFPLVVGLTITAEPIVSVLLTDKWLGAVPFIRIFCMAYLLMPMQVTNLEAIKSLGYSGTTLKLEVVKKIIELAILLVTIPIGVEMIAWGIVLYNIIALFLNIVPNSKLLNYGIKEQILDILPTLWISIIMGAGMYLVSILNVTPALKLTLEIIVGIGLYMLLSIMFHNETYIYLKSLIRTKKRNNE